ncbi:MAG: hypothetical protein KKB59_19650 [Spirochaetes bacterium]|nr:hypothetical protein [Spirochaetota bacterium]
MCYIIGIVGCRSRDTNEDFKLVERKFLDLYNEEKGVIVCSGGCPKGGDRFAKLLHKKYCVPYLEFPANWVKYGKRAGYIRNHDIAIRSDILIACVSPNRTGGTEHTIKEFIEFHEEKDLHIV